MSLLRRLGNWFTTSRPLPIRRRAGWLRPAVEMLEERLAPAAFFESEGNGTFATANVVTIATGDILTTNPNDWLIISGAINSGGDTDFFKFTIGAKSGVFFDIDAQDTNPPLSALDSFIQLFGSDGGEIGGANNDNGYDFQGFKAPTTSQVSPSSKDSSFYYELPAGTYAVRVTGGAGTTGAYELRMLADASYTTSVPTFTSNPMAADTLYLDFDGNTGTTDYWTTATPGYVAVAFDFNSDPTTFSPAERLAIINICRVVSEDYSPFRLKVTTSVPANLNDGMAYQQIITSSPPTVVGVPLGTLGATPAPANPPYANGGALDNVGFTFASSFSNYGGGISGTVMAAAVEEGNTTSHEFGHALGLRHYSANLSSPSPPASIVPSAIMATNDLGLNRETWTTATNELDAIQDDFAVISSSANTFGYRIDDYGNSIALSSLPTIAPGGYLNNGIISLVNDRDVFRFTGAGPTRITVNVDEYINDLDAQVRVFNSAGAQLYIDSPADEFDAEIEIDNLPAGTYYVEVRGSGLAGDAGQYTLTITTSKTSVQVYNGNLVVNDTAANGKNDTLFVSVVPDKVRIHDPNNVLTAGVGTTQFDPNTVDVPLAGFAGSVLINTLGGNDSVTLDLTGPIPGHPLIYNGGLGTNSFIASDTDNLWILTALNTGKIDNLKAAFVNVQSLTGGTLRDVFHFNTNGRVSGSIDGSPGSNWLDYTGITSGILANLQTGVVSRVAGSVRNIDNVLGSVLGNDKITGSINSGVLVGHGKANTITAGNAPSILIGGFGVNYLIGGAASDLIINGKTTYDGDYAKLEAILAIWKKGDSYRTRIDAVQASPNKLTVGATVFLHPGVTPNGIGPRYGNGNFVYLSTIFGKADSDWFFTTSRATLFDHKPGEDVNM